MNCYVAWCCKINQHPSAVKCSFYNSTGNMTTSLPLKETGWTFLFKTNGEKIMFSYKSEKKLWEYLFIFYFLNCNDYWQVE